MYCFAYAYILKVRPLSIIYESQEIYFVNNLQLANGRTLVDKIIDCYMDRVVFASKELKEPRLSAGFSFYSIAADRLEVVPNVCMARLAIG